MKNELPKKARREPIFFWIVMMIMSIVVSVTGIVYAVKDGGPIHGVTVLLFAAVNILIVVGSVIVVRRTFGQDHMIRENIGFTIFAAVFLFVIISLFVCAYVDTYIVGGFLYWDRLFLSKAVLICSFLIALVFVRLGPIAYLSMYRINSNLNTFCIFLIVGMFIAGVINVFCISKTISPIQKGDVLEFGCYEQDADITNGLEKIRWIVKSVDPFTETALLVTEDCLIVAPYGDSENWQESTLRKWLNDDFYGFAFSPEERLLIIPTTVVSTKYSGGVLHHVVENDGKWTFETADGFNEDQSITEDADYFFILNCAESITYFDSIKASKKATDQYYSHYSPGTPLAYWVCDSVLTSDDEYLTETHEKNLAIQSVNKGPFKGSSTFMTVEGSGYALVRIATRIKLNNYANLVENGQIVDGKTVDIWDQEGGNGINTSRLRREVVMNSCSVRSARVRDNALSTPFRTPEYHAGISVDDVREYLLEEMLNPIWVRAWFEYMSEMVDDEDAKVMKAYISQFDQQGFISFLRILNELDGPGQAYLTEGYISMIAPYIEAIKTAKISFEDDIKTKYAWVSEEAGISDSWIIPDLTAKKQEFTYEEEYNEYVKVDITIAGKEYTCYLNRYDRSPVIPE